MISSTNTPQTWDILTTREQEVARLFYRNLSVEEMANRLNISFYTVKNHIRNIYDKLCPKGERKRRAKNPRLQVILWVSAHDPESTHRLEQHAA